MLKEKPVYTPWGAADFIHVIADGITMYSTPSHGGIGISQSRLMEMPEALRDGLWYEEDCAMAKVIVGLSRHFSDEQYAQAKASLKTWYPEAYEAFFQEVIPEGESYIKDQRIFKERHKDDWVGISALGVSEGMVRVTATKGGERGGPENGFNHPEEREFAVPEKEYKTRSRHGFVVDPERHQDFRAWEKLAGAREWKASVLEAVNSRIHNLAQSGNVEEAYRQAKGYAVLSTRPDDWWAGEGKQSLSPGLIAHHASLEWDITAHGVARIPIPNETPYKLPGDDNLYHGGTGERMHLGYEGLVTSESDDETSVYRAHFTEDLERRWTYYGTKADLENGGLSAYLAKIGPEEEVRFWALKNPEEAETLLPEKKSAMPKM